jgi:hypothetical protein
MASTGTGILAVKATGTIKGTMGITRAGMVAVIVAVIVAEMAAGMVAGMVVVLSAGHSAGIMDREEAHPRIILIWAVIDIVVGAEMDNTEI